MVLAAIGAGSLPAAASAAPWLIGAAKVDVTPLAFDASQDLQDFPDASCPRAVFNALNRLVEGAE